MMEATTSALLRRPEDGPRVKGPVAQLTYKARSVETGGAMTVIQTIAAPGEGPPLHVHANDDEFICVLEGRLRVKLAEAIHEAPAGSFVFTEGPDPHVAEPWAGDSAIPVRVHPCVGRHGAILRAQR